MDLIILAQILWDRINPKRWPLKITNLPPGTVLVGGTVRDACLENSEGSHDIDLVVPDKAIRLTEKLAQEFNGTCVHLDTSRDIGRLVLGKWNFDIASQIGETLIDDLFKRDYRLNAIALTLGKKPKLIDPTGGLKDLENKELVAISKENLLKDPLRLIRGPRLMAELGLSMDIQTKNWIKENNKLLTKSAPERIQAEVLKLVNSEWADSIHALMDELELLSTWQNNDQQFRRNSSFLKQAKLLNNHEKQIALPIARLTHLLSNEGLAKLRFSRKIQDRCQKLRYWQESNDGNGFQSLNEKDKLQLHKDLEQDLPALIIGLPTSEQNIWLRRWRDLHDPLFHPFSPIDGKTLQDKLGLASGPILGELMRHLCLENAFGRVANEEDALRLARYWCLHK